MLKSLAIVVIGTGVLTAHAQASTARVHQRAGHHHLAARAPTSELRGLDTARGGLTNAAYTPNPGAAYAPQAFGEARPRLALETAFGPGARGSVGLEHADAPAGLRDINGVTLSVPPPATSLLGAGLSYSF